MRTTRTPTLMARIARLVLVAAITAGPLTPQAHAAPTNAKIEATREQAAEAREKLDSLADDLEERTEEYEELRAAVAETDKLIEKNERQLQRASEDLSGAEDLLMYRAEAIYRRGPVDYVALFLGVVDFSDFVTRIELMRRINEADAAIVSDVKTARAEIEKVRAGLESRRAELYTLKTRADAKRDEVDRAVDEQKRYLASIDAKLKGLIAEERERQARLAAEAAARAAAAARANAQKYPSPRTFDSAALGSPHPEALRAAQKYLGVPYVWGGTSPSGFDCSGLTQYAYAEVGIAIPRNSRSQFRVGAYIPPNRTDLLAPGDLVFFGRGGDPGRIHHVGMYAGGDRFLHAPQTGDVVGYSSLSGRIASRADYVGAVRP